MEPRAHHVLIGLFTLVAILAAIVFFLWLARAHQQGRVEHYRVVFNEPVRGLSKGSAVLYNGIRIGEVSELTLDVSDLRKATARIAIDANIPIRRDTQAQLVMTGITGNSVIELSGGSPMSPLLALPLDDTDPVIKATPSPLNQLLSGGDNIMTNLSELMISAREVLSNDNLAHFGAILANLDSFTESLADQSGGLEGLKEDLRVLSQRAAQAMTDASRLINSTNALVVKNGEQAVLQAGKAMAAIDRAADTLIAMMAENRQALHSGARGLTELGPTLQALRNTLTSIQDIARRIEENPAGYLLGGEKIQEFQP
ncbi:MAG: MlaD family protein [Castellaniella sp.]